MAAVLLSRRTTTEEHGSVTSPSNATTAWTGDTLDGSEGVLAASWSHDSDCNVHMSTLPPKAENSNPEPALPSMPTPLLLPFPFPRCTVTVVDVVPMFVNRMTVCFPSADCCADAVMLLLPLPPLMHLALQASSVGVLCGPS